MNGDDASNKKSKKAAEEEKGPKITDKDNLTKLTEEVSDAKKQNVYKSGMTSTF